MDRSDHSSPLQEKQDTSHHVDVEQAEAVFNDLARQLSRRSESSASTAAVRDLEKDGDAVARFDLREYLSSSNDANQQAGIKHKVFRPVFAVRKLLTANSMSE